MSSRLYQFLIRSGDRIVPSRFQPLWNHEAGPKTVFFWAPTVKWGLVFAGIGDLTRPADKLSVWQSSVLAATGIIWSRYCFVIKPRSYYLMSVQVFLAAIGLSQLARIAKYRQGLQEDSED